MARETGDTLALLSQSTTRADIAGQEARVRAAEASLREAVAGPRTSERSNHVARQRRAVRRQQGRQPIELKVFGDDHTVTIGPGQRQV